MTGGQQRLLEERDRLDELHCSYDGDAKLIESELNQPVERVMADIGIQYQSVARGDLDLMLMAWLPGTHRDYWGKVRNQVLDLGPMYSGRLG